MSLIRCHISIGRIVCEIFKGRHPVWGYYDL